MIRKHVGTAILLSMLIPSGAQAFYLRNYSDWKSMPADHKATYLMGAMDGWLQDYRRDEASWITARRKGLDECMSAQNINPSMLVDVVNSHYANIKADWRVPPALVLESAIQGVCLADINKARTEVGLDPWERKSEQISKDAP